MTRRRKARIPFGFKGKADALTPDRDLVRLGIAAVCERVAELPEPDAPDWFGWEMNESPKRYAAVGCGTRGFVVDAVSGHLMWSGPIEGPKDLPRSLADLAGR